MTVVRYSSAGCAGLALTFTILILFLSAVTLYSNNTQPPQSSQSFVMPNMIFHMPPVNVTLNNENSSATAVKTANNALSISESKAVHESMSTIILQAENKLKSVKKYAEKIPEWLLENKWRTLLWCVAGVYAYTMYRLLSLSSELSNPYAWHNYKSHLSFNDLLQHQDLAHTIIKAVQFQYLPQSVENFFIPFTLFIKDIEKEIATLEQIIALSTYIHMLHINWLFPWQKISLENAQEKLRRVLYIKNIVFAWISSLKTERLIQLAPQGYLGDNT